MNTFDRTGISDSILKPSKSAGRHTPNSISADCAVVPLIIEGGNPEILGMRWYGFSNASSAWAKQGKAAASALP
jgi:hypothetical protein